MFWTGPLGSDFFCDVTGVLVGGSADLRPIAELRHPRYLIVYPAANDRLEPMERMPSLEEVSLYGPGLTDAGLAHLTHLKNLRSLRLQDADVTDAGLVQLDHLPNLRHVGLLHCRVTAKGISELKRTIPRCEVVCWPEPK